jgi:hypothetical protein
MGQYQIKLQELNQVLQTYNLGFMYDFLNDRENGLIFPYFCHFMDTLNEIGLDFSITTDITPQAGIIYKEKLVFISYGLIDRLSKLSELIYCSGTFNSEKTDLRYYDLHFIVNPFKGFQHDVNQFDNDPIYLFIFDNLLSFVVFHEIGHFIHEHGLRKEILNDFIGHLEIEPDELISSHAREIVADNYAFKLLLEKITIQVQRYQIKINTLEKMKNSEAILTIFIITCYFQMMDGSGNYNHFKSTHPEAAMRGCSIMATYIENVHLESDISLQESINIIIGLLTKVFSELDKKYNFDWGSRIKLPEMIEWQEKIYHEYDKWVKK